MLDHAAGELLLAEENSAGSFFLEQCCFFFTVRAHDGLDARIDGARDLDHAAHVQGVRRGDHQHPRAVSVGLNQRIGIGSVAGDGGNAALAELLDDFAVLFGDDEGYASGGERFADASADAAVSDQHDVAGESCQLDGRRQYGQRIVGPLQCLSQLGARANPGLRRLDSVEHQRIERDRDDRSRENKALAFFGHEPQLKTKSRQDEGEFTDLRQACRYRERGIQRITEKQNETKCRQRFAEDDDREDH